MLSVKSQIQDYVAQVTDSHVTKLRYKSVEFQTLYQYHSNFFCFESNRNMKTFILIVACIGLSSAFELSELFSDRLQNHFLFWNHNYSLDRFFCCAFINAKDQCRNTCSGRPCEDTCEARSVPSVMSASISASL